MEIKKAAAQRLRGGLAEVFAEVVLRDHLAPTGTEQRGSEPGDGGANETELGDDDSPQIRLDLPRTTGSARPGIRHGVVDLPERDEPSPRFRSKGRRGVGADSAMGLPGGQPSLNLDDILQRPLKQPVEPALPTAERDAVNLRGDGSVALEIGGISDLSGAIGQGGYPVSGPSIAPASVPGDRLGPNELAGGLIEVTVMPHDSLNYALLHNKRGMFKSFILRKINDRRIDGVRVEVTLHVGTDNSTSRFTLDLTDCTTEITNQVRPALTSEIMCRMPREAVRTLIHVHITRGTESLCARTFDTALLPIEEWRDDNVDRDFLPSFALPRDPAVSRVVDAAQKHLMTLLDDPGAGFDGYQNGSKDFVDAQVQSLWGALLHDFPIHYINPPPTYTLKSQRVRTPSQIIGEHRGTCLDTALLMASCIEYVGLYPVMFLLQGHAFPGYWRSEKAWREEFNRTPTMKGAQLNTPNAADRAVSPWACGRSEYGKVLQLIHDGELVPLESVWLTCHRSFADAVDAGMQNLQNPDEFNCLLDIQRARENDVLPLPVTHGR